MDAGKRRHRAVSREQTPAFARPPQTVPLSLRAPREQRPGGLGGEQAAAHDEHETGSGSPAGERSGRRAGRTGRAVRASAPGSATGPRTWRSTVLAATSPAHAQGGITDDQADVGEVTLGGTISLAPCSSTTTRRSTTPS